MSLLESLLSKFGYSKQESVGGSVLSGLGSIGQDTPFTSPVNYNAFMRKYADEAWVFTCVKVIAEKGAGVPLRVLRKPTGSGGKKLEWLPDHPIQKLLDTANPFMDGHDLVETTLSFQELTGNAYWLLDKFVMGMPTEIFPLNPKRVKIIPHATEYISGYEFDMGVGKDPLRFPKEQVLHFKTFNPTNDFYGLSPLQAGRKAVSTIGFADQYNLDFFRNGAEPGGQLVTKGRLDNKQRNRIAAAWRSAHQGEGRAHRIALMEMGTEWKATGLKHKEMEFAELKKMTREDILGVFGVPPALVGIFEFANYANSKEQRRIFWLDTMTPKLKKMVGVVNSFLVEPWDPTVTVRPDLSGIEALQEDRELAAKVDAILTAAGIRLINEVREDRNLPPVKWGKTWNAPVNLVPIDDDEARNPEPAPAPAPKPDDDDDKGKGFVEKMRDDDWVPGSLVETARALKAKREREAKEKTSPEDGRRPIKTEVVNGLDAGDRGAKADSQGDRVWAVFKGLTENWEKVFRIMMRQLFDMQEREVLGRLRDSDFKNLARQFQLDANQISGASETGNATSMTGEQIKELRRDMMAKQRIEPILPDRKTNLKAFRKAAVKVLKGAVQARGELEAIGISVDGVFDVTNVHVTTWIDDKAFKFSNDVNKTTEDKLRDELKNAIDAAEPIADTEKRISRVFEIAKGARTERIARTEIVSALNKGAFESFRQSGRVREHRWVSSRDGLVRDSHQINGQKVKLGESFSNGLKFPGDPAGPVSEVVNCRCTIAPVVDRSRRD